MIEEKNNPFDEFADRYDNWFDTEEGKIIYETEMNALGQIYPDSKNAIEIGVGSGRFAKPLMVNFGIDTSFELAKSAKFRDIKVVVGKGENIPFKDNIFDTVLIVVTLCFLENFQESLKEVKRIMEEDGQLIIGFIPAGSEWGRLYKKQGELGHRFYKYARFYLPDEIKGFIEDIGFKIEDNVSTLFQTPFNIKQVEMPKKGIFQEAGFVVIRASMGK